MNIPIVEMDPEVAQRAYLDYREAVKAAHEREATYFETRATRRRAEMERADEAIMAGYRQIAMGKSVVDLRAAILAGGQDELGRPRIAVCRADDSRIRLTLSRGGRVQFSPVVERITGWELDARSSTRVFDFLGLFPDNEKTPWGYEALAPHIPPALRPKASLERYHLLWEAEWRKSAPPPARDPALLRHIGGSLYVVLATWDLTDLEMLVLGR